MTTSTATSQCTACGADIYGTRFCESCGAPVAGPVAVSADPTESAIPPQGIVTAAPAPSVSVPPRPTADATQRVRFGLLLALNGFIWTSILPVAVAAVIDLVEFTLGVVTYGTSAWPVIVIAGVSAPAIMVVGFVIAANSAAITPRARVWAIVLAVLAAVINGGGAIYLASVAGFTAVSAPGLGSLAALGAWGLVARFRGAGYWAFALLALLAGVWTGLMLVPYVSIVGSIVTVVYWVPATLGVVAFARAQEARSAARAVEPGRAGESFSGARGTNGLALTSLILSLLGASLIAVILGHIARSQIRRTGENGAGMALAGLIIGYVSLSLALVVSIVALVIVLRGGFG